MVYAVVESEQADSEGIQMSAKAMEGALVGRFVRKLDAMRRVRIPSEWFAIMGQPKSVVVMAHPEEKCLVLLSEATYAAQVRQMRREASKNADARKELAHLLGEVEHLEVNARHCIRINDKLLRYARIKDCVSLFGDVRYIKIEKPKRVRSVTVSEAEFVELLLKDAN